jgi:hypothetical protein
MLAAMIFWKGSLEWPFAKGFLLVGDVFVGRPFTLQICFGFLILPV